MTYTVKYRQPGQWFWRRVRRVKGDGVKPEFRFFHTDKDEMIFVSNDAEVRFDNKRQMSVEKKLSAEAGQQVTRAIE